QVSFAAGHILGKLEHEQVAPPVDRRGDPLKKDGQESIGGKSVVRFPEDQYDPLCPAAGQSAGGSRGVVVEVASSLQSALPRFLGDLDARHVVKDERDGRSRYTGEFGYITA